MERSKEYRLHLGITIAIDDFGFTKYDLGFRFSDVQVQDRVGGGLSDSSRFSLEIVSFLIASGVCSFRFAA